MEKQMDEIHSFLGTKDRPDVRIVALNHVLALTGDRQSLQAVCNRFDILATVASFLDSADAILSKDASLVLVNVSAYERGCEALLKNVPDMVRLLLKHITKPDSRISDPCCMILSNLTRPLEQAEIVAKSLLETSDVLDGLLTVLTKVKHNEKGQKLHYLGPVLSNLTQSPHIRRYVMRKSGDIIKKLLPFTTYQDSTIKRGGIVGALRNCCFETDNHCWLLSEEVDILPRLLLPLADNMEYDEEDNDKMPIDLQYLPEDKTIEADPDIRCMLLEALTQLCTLRVNREYIRDKNAYVILRQLHKQEEDDKVLTACENLVNILIRTEEEIGHDNLKSVEIPNDLEGKLAKLDGELNGEGK